MFLQLIFLFFLLLIIFQLAQRITKNIYLFFYLLFGSQRFSVGMGSVILLPGTIVHELSHFLVATILRVPVYGMTVIPKIEKPAFALSGYGEVRAGRVELGEADPFRMSLIGLAPIIIGLTLIYLVGVFLSYSNTPGECIRPLPVCLTQNLQPITYNFLGLYLLFTISVTMFSSKKDMESFLISGPIIILIITSLYLIGVRINLEMSLVNLVTVTTNRLNLFLLVTGILDFIILILLQGVLSLVLKLKNR